MREINTHNKTFIYASENGEFSLVKNPYSEDILVYLSTHLRCPVGCSFCCNNSYGLKAQEYSLAELDYNLSCAEAWIGERINSIMLTFLGDPLLCKAVPDFISQYPERYFFVSSPFLKTKRTVKIFDELENKPNVTIQYSLHSTSNEHRERIIHPKVMPIEDVAAMFSKSGKPHVINTFFWKGMEFNIPKLRRIFCNQDITLKLTAFEPFECKTITPSSIDKEKIAAACEKLFKVDLKVW